MTIKPLKLIQFTAIVQTGMVIAIIAAGMFTERLLPETLQEYLIHQREAPSSPLMFLLTPVLICGIVGLIGMMAEKRWAQNVYLLFLIIGYPAVIGLGASVAHPIDEILDSTATMIDGILILLICIDRGVISFHSPSENAHAFPDAKHENTDA